MRNKKWVQRMGTFTLLTILVCTLTYDTQEWLKAAPDTASEARYQEAASEAGDAVDAAFKPFTQPIYCFSLDRDRFPSPFDQRAKLDRGQNP